MEYTTRAALLEAYGMVNELYEDALKKINEVRKEQGLPLFFMWDMDWDGTAIWGPES